MGNYENTCFDPMLFILPELQCFSISGMVTIFVCSTGELFLSLVVSSKAHARIVKIDPSAALSLDGVHSFVDHTDVPGLNMWGFDIPSEEIFASKEVRAHRYMYCEFFPNSKQIA